MKKLDLKEELTRRSFLKGIGLLGILGCSHNPLSYEFVSETQAYENKMNEDWKYENPENVRIATEKMQAAASKLHTLKDVKDLVKKFKYRPEKRNWQSNILTLFYYDLWGDCEDASILGIWSLDKIKIPAREMYLQDYEYNDSKPEYHSVALSYDNKIMISENMLFELDSEIYTLMEQINRCSFHSRFDRIYPKTRVSKIAYQNQRRTKLEREAKHPPYYNINRRKDYELPN